MRSDDQDILHFNINTYFDTFITPIDQIRSKFNALPSNSELSGPNGFQESRCHAFYRMIGFPVVANATQFYSPGFDINLNLDSESQSKIKDIKNIIKNNKNLINRQLNPREDFFKSTNKIFSDGGFKATAISIGSIFIRSFVDQFGEVGPLEFDKQIQFIEQREEEISFLFGENDTVSDELADLKSKNLLASKHLLKPFIVDPRIDDSIRPAKNRIAAPFLLNKSQLKIFQSADPSFGSLKRPFIERVISIRFNNKNQISGQNSDIINETISKIKDDDNILNSALISISNNPLEQLFNSDQVVFNNYFKLIRKLIEVLVVSLKRLSQIRGKINFIPIPNSKQGPEAGSIGGKLQDPIDGDINNKFDIEEQILNLKKATILSDISFATDFGLDTQADLGDFVFSNLDDMVFIGNKVAQKSYQENLNKLVKIRNQFGSQGLDDLKTIEIIMGEFSGLGLIDIIAIQSAFWLMDLDKLIDLIDTKSYERALKRQNLNLQSQSGDVIAALTDFETKLKSVYLIIQTYFNQVMNGKIYQGP